MKRCPGGRISEPARNAVPPRLTELAGASRRRKGLRRGQAPAGFRRHEPWTPRRWGKGRAVARILVVDDDPHLREVVRFALERAGHSVIEAADGAAALARVRRASPPDLVVLDIADARARRPRGLPRACARASAVPILFLSSRDDELDRVLGLELGADDYVTKPFSPRELVARVKARAAPRATRAPGAPDDAEPIAPRPARARRRAPSLHLGRARGRAHGHRVRAAARAARRARAGVLARRARRARLRARPPHHRAHRGQPRAPHPREVRSSSAPIRSRRSTGSATGCSATTG